MNEASNKSSRTAYILAAVIFIASVVIYLFFERVPSDGKLSNFAQTDITLPINFEDKADVHSFLGKSFFLSTKDGMTYYTQTGEIRWTDIYSASLKDPVMKGAGVYAGISDLGGVTLYIYSNEGLQSVQAYEERILSFYVSPAGYSSVIRKDNDDYAIHAYNPSGVEVNCYFNRSAGTFPITSAISRDGRILAIAVADTNSQVVQTKLMLLYNNINEKQAYLNGIFYQEIFENELIGSVDFLPGGELIYFSDNRIGCITTSTTGNNTPGEKWHVPLYNEINAFAVTDNGNAVIACGKALPFDEAALPGTIEIYNASGSKMNEFHFNGHSETDKLSLTVCGNYVIAASANNYAAFDEKGRLKWRYIPVGDVKKLITLDNRDTILQLEFLTLRVLKKS